MWPSRGSTLAGSALAPGTRLPSYAEIAERKGVSQIVIRHAVKLLFNQGLVRTVERRGTFVADRLDLVRSAPERQMASPEQSFSQDTDREVRVERSNNPAPHPPGSTAKRIATLGNRAPRPRPAPQQRRQPAPTRRI